MEADVLLSPPEHLQTEIAVVGSGPGGAITACLLAEAGRETLLLEEGPWLPLESSKPFSREEMVQKYRNAGITVAIGRAKVAYVEGCCVGGGSEINSGLYYRTPAEMLETWRKEYAVEGLTEAELEPHFAACEQAVNVCYLPGAAPATSLKLHEGALRLGWKSQEVPRWFRYETSATDKPPQGTRQSMTKTFIPRFLAAGGRLMPSVRVLSLQRSGQQWLLHAQVSNHTTRRTVAIKAQTVFVACGAVQTPALLRRSGFTTHIGNTLKLHPTIKVVARFPETINAPGIGVGVHQVKEFAPHYSFGCSISSLPHLALAFTDHPPYLQSITTEWQRMGVYYAMTSGGQGSIRPVPFFRDPQVRYRLEKTELRVLAESLHRLCQALFAAGAERLYPSVAGLGPFTKTADLSRIPALLPPQRTNLMTIHLMASCPMGENRDRCATDSVGQVHGVKDLYIADASLLCSAPGVNPQGTIMALVRRNALHFLGKL